LEVTVWQVHVWFLILFDSFNYISDKDC
jgi:hypothetical protein